MGIAEILGYLGAVLTGLILGLLGGGGAAVSIPLLKYVFGVPASIATGYSLLIVFFTALLGTTQNIRKGLVRFKALLRCGIPALVSIYVMRRFLIHSIPDHFGTIGSYILTKDSFILLLLSFFMGVVAKGMIWPDQKENGEFKVTPYWWILIQSVLIGLFTGLVGAGGGFLLIPLLLATEPMEFRNATATSLALVTLNSLIGFIGDMQSNIKVDWMFLVTFISCSILGVMIGLSVAHKIDNKKLRQIFGYVMMSIAVYILIQELVLKFL
jgi:uncharacterized membrane protein YfcA